MLIRQYQSGGITYIPTSTRTQEPAAQTAADSSSSSKVPGFAKEIIDLVKENGLNNDVNYFLNAADSILNTSLDPTGENITMKQVLQLQRLASRVKINYEQYKEAAKSLESEDAWGEVATNKRGQLYVMTEDGDVSTISGKEYSKNTDKYSILTNGDILNLRRNSDKYTFSEHVLDDVSAAVGMKSITEYAKNLIKEFGSTTLTGMSERQAERIKSGLEHIVSGDLGNFRGVLEAGPDGVYKVTQESTIADTGLNEALAYLYSSLPNTYKNALNAKSVAEGIETNSLLGMMVYANTDRKITADYDSTASASAGYTTGSSESQTTDNLAMRVARGDLPPTNFVISPRPEFKSDVAMMAVEARNAGRPQTDAGTPLDKNNCQDLLIKATQFAGADFSSMCFGNQSISSAELASLVWDGESNVTVLTLPMRMDEHGKRIPDFSAIKKLNVLNKEIKEHPNMTSLEINERFANLQIPGATWDEKSRSFIFDPTNGNVGKFVSIAAYGNQANLKLKDESLNYVEQVSKRVGKTLMTEYNNLVLYNTSNPTKKTKAKNDYTGVGNGFLGIGSDAGDFYHGNLYVAINDPMQAQTVTKDQYEPKTNYTDVYKKWDIMQQTLAAQQNREQSGFKTNFTNGQ